MEKVLRKNGILRLAVPNFEALISVYQKTEEIEKILGPLYGKWKVNNSDYIYHKTVYDNKSLTSLLQQLGFREIKQWDWRQVFKNNPEYDDHSQAYFPHMDKENGILISLNIECKKIMQKNITKISSFFIFLISLFLSYFIGEIFYNSIDGTDFYRYFRYIEYFNGSIQATSREQRLFYFLVYFKFC